MDKDAELRKAASAAQAHLRAAEHNLEQARADFETAVRKLYVYGASIREIAQLLELSHQRIHQLVGGKPQTWWQRLTGGSEEPHRNCSFCGKPPSLVSKLVAGPSVYICDVCVEAAAAAFDDRKVREDELLFERLAAQSRQRCSFCGKRNSGIPRVSASGHQICTACLSLAQDIIAKDLSAAD